MNFSFITITTKYMEQSIHFYHEIMGMPIHVRRKLGEGMEMIMFGEPGSTLIELVTDVSEGDSAAAHSMITIGLSVDSLEKEVERLADCGIPLSRGPISPAPGVCFSFVKDPNGIEIQLIEQKAGH